MQDEAQMTTVSARVKKDKEMKSGNITHSFKDKKEKRNSFVFVFLILCSLFCF